MKLSYSPTRLIAESSEPYFELYKDGATHLMKVPYLYTR